MSKQIVNIGSSPNDGTGDQLRTAFDKLNDNHNEIYSAGPVGTNLQVVTNTIQSTDVNGNINLAPNGSGSIVLFNTVAMQSTLGVSSLATLESASITNGATVGGTLGVTGVTTLSTLTLNGLGTLDSVSITNGATVGGTLGVTGLSTLDSLAITNGATVGGTLGITGLSTLDSVSITNGATVGGTLGVTGLSTLDSLAITNDATVSGTLIGKINIPVTVTPASSIGAADDLTGDIAWDASYIYVCTADYDGATSIWARSAIATW